MLTDFRLQLNELKLELAFKLLWRKLKTSLLAFVTVEVKYGDEWCIFSLLITVRFRDLHILVMIQSGKLSIKLN